MKINKILVSFITTVTILSVSTTAMADALVNNGSGGNYSYELWQDADNIYYLKIWQRNYYRKGEPSKITHSFESSREALNYFDCYYAERSLPVCPRQ